MKALFRCDAMPGIGGGHVFRCLTLADEMANNGWQCLFATSEQSEAIVPALADSRHAILILDNDTLALPQERQAAAIGECLSGPFDWLVCDHYDLDETFEKSAAAYARKIFVLDDLADRNHTCHLLLDFGLAHNERDYQPLTPRESNILNGPRFAPLRPQFRETRNITLERRKKNAPVNRIMINFGALDGKNMTPVALNAIKQADIQCFVDVVLGAGAKNGMDVEKAAQELGLNVAIHRGVKDMAGIMMNADLSVAAGGSGSCWERCCLGLPSLIVTTSEDQKKTTARLADLGAAEAAGDWTTITKSQLAERLRSLWNDKHRLEKMSRIATNLCDGMGARRIIEALQEHSTSTN